MLAAESPTEPNLRDRNFFQASSNLRCSFAPAEVESIPALHRQHFFHPYSLHSTATVMDPIQQDAMDMTPDHHGNYHVPTGLDGADDSSHSTIGYQQRPQSSDFPHSGYSPQADTNSPNMAYQQQAMQTSRPASGLSDSTNRHGNQDPNQRSNGQEKTQNSVVIKVGMVGDAQIGKTSLMVKYVEGSWDEDYIQTLGRDA